MNNDVDCYSNKVGNSVTMKINKHKKLELLDHENFKRINKENYQRNVLEKVKEKSRDKKEIEGEGEKTTNLVFGNLHATHLYYTNINVGRETFTVQLDTGSVNINIPGTDCHQFSDESSSDITGICSDSDNFYNIEKSPTASRIGCRKHKCPSCDENNKCIFQVIYGDGSFLEGPLIEDVIKIGNLQTNMSFGVIERENSNFSYYSTDGIMGLGWQSLDKYDGDSILSSLVDTYDGKLRDVFSLCIPPFSGGFMTIGSEFPTEDDGFSFHVDDDPVYIDLVKPYDFYRVPMQQIYIDNKRINVNSTYFNTTTIIDSGTTLILLKEEAYNAVKTIFQENYSDLPYVVGDINIFDSPNYCFEFTNDELESFPELKFVIDKYEFILKPKYYFMTTLDLTTSKPNCFYLGIENYHDADYNILGDVFMQDFYIIFNRMNHSIGFADVTHCGNNLFYSGAIHSGNNQHVNVGKQIQPLQVEVKYSDDTPVVGIIVEYKVIQGTIAILNPKSSSSINSYNTHPQPYTLVGRTTDKNGIATLDGVFVGDHGTTVINAYIAGSIKNNHDDDDDNTDSSDDDDSENDPDTLSFTIYVNGTHDIHTINIPYSQEISENTYKKNIYFFGFSIYFWLVIFLIIMVCSTTTIYFTTKYVTQKYCGYNNKKKKRQSIDDYDIMDFDDDDDDSDDNIDYDFILPSENDKDLISI